MGLEHDFASEVATYGLALRAGRPIRGLTSRGHLDTDARQMVAPEILDAVRQVFTALGGDEEALAAKAPRPIRPDLVDDDNRLVEVDEVQHFTSARGATFEHYPPSAALGFSPSEYAAAVRAWSGRADRAFAHKRSADFDFIGGRAAQRAYLDALRDLFAPALTGHALVRVAVPDRGIAAAARRFVDERNS